jgi:GNAT superfamily N-acetyltransferase
MKNTVMLVIKRAKKTDHLTQLLQHYCEALTDNIGALEVKDQASLYHSGLPIAYFNKLIVTGMSVNYMEVSALLENAKQYELPFVCMLNQSLIDLKQVVKKSMCQKGSFSGMYYNLRYDIMKYDAHPAAKLIEVQTQEQLYEWVDVFCHAFNLQHDQVERVCSGLISQESPIKLYIVQVYQKTIACSMTVIKDDQALLLWDTVLPMYRRQGVGSMMLLERLEQCKSNGIKEAYTLGFHSSYESAKHVGFKPFVKLGFYRYDPPLDHGA